MFAMAPRRRVPVHRPQRTTDARVRLLRPLPPLHA